MMGEEADEMVGWYWLPGGASRITNGRRGAGHWRAPALTASPGPPEAEAQA